VTGHLLDIAGNDAGDDAGVWMTYDELAVVRSIQRDGARRLAQRHRWRRHAGNDGKARVLVPREWMSGDGTTPRDSRRDVARDKTAASGTVAPDVAGVVTALQGAIDTLRQQLGRADARADELRIWWEQARAQAQAAQQTADELRRLEEARKGQGRWARLRAAWRGR
jgi:hypothetical protein